MYFSCIFVNDEGGGFLLETCRDAEAGNGGGGFRVETSLGGTVGLPSIRADPDRRVARCLGRPRKLGVWLGYGPVERQTVPSPGLIVPGWDARVAPARSVGERLRVGPRIKEFPRIIHGWV